MSIPTHCTVCRHQQAGTCTHPQSPRNHVTGKPTRCCWMRQGKNQPDGICGPEGRLFEPGPSALRSYRCYHYPQTPYGQPVVSETGVLPFVQIRAPSATHAMEQAAAVTGCVIDRAERLEGGAA